MGCPWKQVARLTLFNVVNARGRPWSDMKQLIEDTCTPSNKPLSAKYKRSYAFLMMTEKAPLILQNVLHSLEDPKTLEELSNRYGQSQELEAEVGTSLEELRQLLERTKSCESWAPLASQEEDTDGWNQDLEAAGKLHANNFYSSSWLLAECYLYRKVHDIFATKKVLTDWDPFRKTKENLLERALKPIESLTDHLVNKKVLEAHEVNASLYQDFTKVLKHALWANKFDPARFPERSSEVTSLEESDSWDDNLIVDDMETTFVSLLSAVPLKNPDGIKVVDYVMDNCGLELLCDLCLADLLISRFQVDKVTFHVKRIPWFVSDVTEKDLKHTLEKASQQESSLQVLARRWQDYLDYGVWNVKAEPFWTRGKSYTDMSGTEPALYEELQQSHLVVFKGDLNYRKLVQERNWVLGTSFRTALGRFRPGPLVTLRTNKSEVVAGICNQLAKAASRQDQDWLLSAKYGLVQFNV